MVAGPFCMGQCFRYSNQTVIRVALLAAKGEIMRLGCTCSGDDTVSDYNFAIIDIDLDYVKWLLRMMQKAKDITAAQHALTTSVFYALSFFDNNAEYFREIELIGEDLDEIERGEFRELADDAYLAEDPLPVAALTVVISDDSIYWQGHPKHGNGMFETSELTGERLKALVNTLQFG